MKTSDKEQLKPIKDFIPKQNLNPEIITEIKRIEEEEKKVNKNKMVYKATNKTYDFRKFKTIRALVVKLEIMILIWIQQMLNK